MKSCSDVRDALLRSESLSAEELRAHIATCPACAILANSPAAFPRVLHAADGTGAASVDAEALFHRLKDRLLVEKDAAGWLRSRPTWMRRAIALATSGFLCGVGLAVMRPDMGVYPMDRMILMLIAISVPLVFTSMIALRPAYRPAMRTEALVAISLASLVLLFVISALPAAHEAHSVTIAAAKADLLPASLPCFVLGTLIALPVYAISRLLDHRVSRVVALLSAVAAGFTGNFMLQLHCPATNPGHLIFAHFSVALIMVAFVAMIAVVPWERWTRR